MKADLHVHSHYSDGADSIETIMTKAKQNGVTHISLVDHDTVDGQDIIRQVGRAYNITTIPGIEISAFDYKRKRKVHILGYHYRPVASHILKVCNPILERRNELSLWQIQQLRKLGYEIEPDIIKEKALPSQTIYKQHVMEYLIKAPYSSTTYKELYQKLFKNLIAGDIEYVDVFAAVEAIVKDGGLAVVAHPGQLDSYDLVPELVEVGLGGIERNHIDHTEQDHRKVEVLAKSYNLVMTGGSDYHGSFGVPIQIGDITSPLNPLLS
ncbi:PHP domain-containing protein [Ornithinibacillus massiliensis]|uniref:PHP domain-containing protein n=1 Tax=Ornithinibacillus massiliensis TaxID=1944633 RepID=A0ABS5MDR9_9BACI|nr:PHP domain-containing protein [Ornithinibacillus massiliensis]MBS3679893.1 PHP domain-containing protein [Ornithinibacillus massiliensis]